MNYIPGFSNYLRTTVPRYAVGGRVMDGEPMMYRNEPMFGDEYNMFGSEMMLPPMDQYAQPMMYGDPMAAAAPVMDTYQQAAVEPMTQEVAPAEVPFDPNTIDLSALDSLYGMNLDSLYGMNFASDFGGVGNRYGGIYKDDPNTEYISAPRSNRGNATGGAGNTFIMRADQPVRLVDLNTNTVIYEGTGYDAAREATRLGQNLSDTMGRKAQYNIQTANPAGEYTTVANEKKNKSTLGQIASAAGTVLPLAMMAIPGVNAALLGANFAKTLGGQLAFGALTGGASSALKGQNILKGAALGGLTAAGGALIPKIPAIGDLGKLAKPLGTGIGATVGGLATGQNLKNSLLGGVASGALAYAAPGIQDAIKGIGQGPNLSTGSAPSATPSATPSGPAPIATVTANTGVSAPVSFGGGSSPQTKVAELEPPATIVSGSGSPFAASFPIPANVPSGALPSTLQQPKTEIPTDEEMTEIPTDEEMKEILVRANQSYLSPDVLAGMAEFEKNPIISEGSKIEQPTSVPVTGGLSPDVLAGIAEFEKNPIISEGSKIEQPTNTGGLNLDLGVLDRVSDMEMENYKEPIVVEGSKIEPTSVSVLPPIGSVVDTLPPLDLKADPELTDKKKLGLEEYLRIAGLLSDLVGGAAGGGQGQTGTYGGGGTGRLNPIFSAKLPSAGGLGTIGANRTARPMGDVDWLTYGTRPELNFFDYASQNNPAPITTPIPNEPRGPSMYAPDVDNVRFAQGGSLAAKRGGPPRRTEFAVNGAGTGRSDDIPAVLSDGEYVIDAETVALLGDGSNKAGAKKLDDLRVKVRKHKGQKLAKGRFSAKAKKPEAYLSGGRI